MSGRVGAPKTDAHQTNNGAPQREALSRRNH